MFGASGAVPVFGLGRWWTILSAGWLHGGAAAHPLQHDVGAPARAGDADIYGAGRMVIIYTIAGAAGFLLSSRRRPVMPAAAGASAAAPLTLGASAPIFGLLGALVYYGRRGGSSMVRGEAMGYALTLFVFGLIMPGVDNYAHAGGFVGGYLAGMWLDPLKRERMDHLVAPPVLATALRVARCCVLWP